MVKKSEDLKKSKKSEKITFFIFTFFCWRKKCHPLSFPIFGGRDSTRALQSNLFQNPGGYPEPDGREGRTKEILGSNIGFIARFDDLTKEILGSNIGFIARFDDLTIWEHPC